MKKKITGITAFLLCAVLLLTALAGCSSTGKPLMELDGVSISVNMYQLYLSRMKGMLASSYAFGSDATTDTFWDTVMSTDGTTYNQYYSETVLDNTKTYLAALYEFENRGLKLPKSTLEEIDDRLQELIDYDADGSKTKFNSILSEYGANYNVLREAYIVEAKIAMLKDEIYGKNGQKIGDEVVNEYYQANYARFKQMYYYTYDYIFYTDDNGDDIFYQKDGKIAYDTNATPKKDEKGNAVLDSDGQQIYIKTENGTEKIAYDTENGIRRNKTDDEGNAIIDKITGDRLQKILDTAAADYLKAQEAAKSDNKFDEFDKLATSNEEYASGIYVTRGSDYYADTVIKAVFEMEMGEVRLVESDYGMHIIMRYELEERGYNESANSDFFKSTTTGTYVFMDDLKNIILAETLAPYKKDIVVDEKLLKGVDMKSVGVNFDF